MIIQNYEGELTKLSLSPHNISEFVLVLSFFSFGMIKTEIEQLELSGTINSPLFNFTNNLSMACVPSFIHYCKLVQKYFSFL